MDWNAKRIVELEKQEIKHTLYLTSFSNTVVIEAFDNAICNTEVNKGWL